MINEYINENYEKIIKAIERINVKDKEDIIHETILMFMISDKAETIISGGYANKYIVGMFKMNAFSKTSPYQQKYNKMNYCELIDGYNYKIVEDEPCDKTCLADLENKIKNLKIFVFDKMMFVEYINNKLNGSYSVRQLSSEVNIGQATLNNKIRQAKTELIKIKN